VTESADVMVLTAAAAGAFYPKSVAGYAAV